MTKRVVNTRIGDELYEKLSSHAKKRRVTISNLVRNIVEDSLTLSGKVFEVVDEKIRRHLHPKDRIVGYNILTLSKDAVCDLCGKDQAKGTQTHMAYLENTSKSLIICEECKDAIEAHADVQI